MECSERNLRGLYHYIKCVPKTPKSTGWRWSISYNLTESLSRAAGLLAISPAIQSRPKDSAPLPDRTCHIVTSYKTLPALMNQLEPDLSYISLSYISRTIQQVKHPMGRNNRRILVLKVSG